MSDCVKCGKPLEKQAIGRPRAYCSVACRRSAEMEIRRADRAIEKVEEHIRECRFGWLGRHESDIPRYQGELDRLEVRLRELLGAQDD